MADTVRVQFSASIGALIKGVDDAKSAIELVKESTDKVTEGAKQLLETFGVAFSVDKISEFVGQMAEMGEQVERSSAILGTSTKSVQELGFIAKSTGGDAEGLALAMERLQVNLQKAQAGAGPAYQALQALGLSAKALSALPLDAQLNRIADAFAKFADGPNKTAIAIELLGRAGAQMIPLLDQGSAGLDRWRQAADDAGVVMTRSVLGALTDTEHALVTARASIMGLGEVIVATFSKSIVEAAHELTEFTSDLSALIQTSHLGEAAMQALSDGVKIAAANFASLGVVAADVLSLQWGKVADDWRAGNAEILRIHQEGQAKLLASATQAKAVLQNILSAEAGAGTNLPQAPSSAAPNRSDISAQLEQFQTQIKLADESYKQIQEQLGAEVKLHQITYDQESQLLLAALDKRHSAELAALDAEQAVGGLTTAQYQKIVDERKLIDQKYAADHQKIINQTAEQDVKAWESALTPLQSAFDSQLKKLLAGTETWGQAMKAVFADLVLDAIKALEKLAVEKAAAGLTSLVGGGPSSLLGGLIGGGAQAAAMTANTEALFANTAALYASSSSSGASALAGAAGGASGFLSGFKSLFSLFGIAALDVGGYVLGSGLAMIHAGETVVPASVSTPFGGGGGGGFGGGNVTFAPNLSRI